MKAFYLQIWFQDDFCNFWGACLWEDDLAVCRQAGARSHEINTDQIWCLIDAQKDPAHVRLAATGPAIAAGHARTACPPPVYADGQTL